MQANIQLFLVERYLNGYTLSDDKYAEVVSYFVNKIKHISVTYLKEKTVQSILGEELGSYNQLNASLYKDIITEYLFLKNQSEDIYDLL